MDNSADRLVDVFFYGLYMDPELLQSRGVTPRNPRTGVLPGYRLRIGRMATLLRVPRGEAHGIVYALTHEELNSLYWGAGLDAYVAEPVTVRTSADGSVAALCCNLLVPPDDEEENPAYLGKLNQCMTRLGLPLPGL